MEPQAALGNDKTRCGSGRHEKRGVRVHVFHAPAPSAVGAALMPALYVKELWPGEVKVLPSCEWQSWAESMGLSHPELFSSLLQECCSNSVKHVP